MRKLYIFIGVGLLVLIAVGLLVSGNKSIIEKANSKITNFNSITSNLLLGERSEESKKITNSTNEVRWRINKTGAEESLIIDYEIIDETSTIFCIQNGDKQDYETRSLGKGRDTTKVPLEKIEKSNKFTIDEVEIDVKSMKNKEVKCFTVNYQILEEGMKFKLGWESVLVDSTASTDSSAYGNNENICVSPNGNINVATINAGSDIQFSNSSNNGLNWTSSEIYSGAVQDLNMLCAPNGDLMVIYEEGSNILMHKSTDGGTSWGQSSIQSSSALSKVSCVVDGNNIAHCCAYQDAFDDLWYSNSSNPEGGFEITDVRSDHCDIEVDTSSNVFIVISDSTSDNVSVYTSTDSYTTRNTVVEGDIIFTNRYDGLSMDVSNSGELQIAFVDSNDLWYCNGTIGSGFSCGELVATASYNPDILYSEQDKVFIAYQDAIDATGDIYYINSSDKLTWGTPTQLPDESSTAWISLADSSYAGNNRANGTMHFVYFEATDMYYDSMVIGTLPADPCIYTSGNWTLSASCIFNNTIIAIDGNLSLSSGGSLTLNNATLNFTDSNQWIIFDNVADGNKLIMNGNSTIN